MSHLFDRTSLAIEINSDFFPFDIGYLYGSAPFFPENPILRVYTHEVLHFWQALSTGFIANLAFGEWNALLAYEKDKNPIHQINLLQSFTEVDTEFGFSPFNLSEALCRFWEIHILNPEQVLTSEQQDTKNSQQNIDSLAVERGMEILKEYPVEHPLHNYPPHIVYRIVNARKQPYHGDTFDSLYSILMKSGDAYAMPYSILLEKFGTRNSVILFPLVGYFSLQNKYPVKVFADAIDKLTKVIELDNLPKLGIEETWQKIYPIVRQVCQRSSLEVTGLLLTPAWGVMAGGLAESNPVYNHYFQLIKYFMQDRWLYGKKFNIDPDPLFALPGDSEARTLLSNTFRPPITIFRNGIWDCGGIGQFKKINFVDCYEEILVIKSRLDSEVIDQEAVLNRDELSSISLDIHTRVGKMRHAAVVARYKC